MKTFSFILALLPFTLAQAAPAPSVAQSNNQFAFELYEKLSKENNSFFSPYSVTTALAMTYAGAGGTTAREMEKVLHIDPKTTTHREIGKLIESINALNGTDVKMSVANRLFGAVKFNFKETFLDTLNEFYKAPIECLDFVNKAEASRKHINAWVEEKTNNKIKELLAQGMIKSSTCLVLVNAIYFYGDWAKQFNENNTQTGKFYTDATNSIDTKLMYQLSHYEYAETGSFKAIRVPYKGNKVSMEIYLPHKKDGLTEFEKTLNAREYEKWSKQFKTYKVSFTLPKFKMTTSFSLEDKLKTMGMTSAFDDQANFRGMVEAGSIKISKVVHKAYIDVSEKGTEAAAATAVIMQVTSSRMDHEFEVIKEFRADHPFFFLIRENQSGTILFMGRMVEPEKA